MESRPSVGGQALILRVMRLTTPLPSLRPSLPVVTAAAAADLPDDDAFLRASPSWEGEGAACGVGVTTILPSSFGSIFASETFRSFIAVYNCGLHPASQVSITVELESSAQRGRVLLDTRGDPCPSIPSRDSMTHVVSAHLPDTGVHVLKCAATYIDPTRQLRTFRQYYRFNVLAPLEPAVSVLPFDNVITPRPLETTVVVHPLETAEAASTRSPPTIVQFLVELRVLNATPAPVYISEAALQAFPVYTVVNLAREEGAVSTLPLTDGNVETDSIVDRPRRASVGVGDTRSFLFLVSRVEDGDPGESARPNGTAAQISAERAALRAAITAAREAGDTAGPPDVLRARALALRARERNSSSKEGSMNGSTRRRREIGALRIVWKSALGEAGRMESATVAYEPRRKRADVELSVVAVPSEIRVQHPFAARCRVRNNTMRALRLYLQVRRDLVGEIVPVGVSGVPLRDLPPGEAVECCLTLLPLRSGQHAISGVRVFDMVSRKAYNAEPPVVSVL